MIQPAASAKGELSNLISFVRVVFQPGEIIHRDCGPLAGRRSRYAWSDLSTSVPERLARLLLVWSDEPGQKQERSAHCRVAMTHEEIGEFIGASRETVTRTLSIFKNRRLVAQHGCTLTIPSRVALEMRQYAGPCAALVLASMVSCVAELKVPRADTSTITVRGAPEPLSSVAGFSTAWFAIITTVELPGPSVASVSTVEDSVLVRFNIFGGMPVGHGAPAGQVGKYRCSQ